MDDDSIKLSNESILVVNQKGVLKRIKTPFRAIVIIAIGNYNENDVCIVQALYLSKEHLLIYYIKGEAFYYYYFAILD